VSRLAIFAFVIIATLALAIGGGWSSYRASPEGALLYTPIGPCPVMQHSFTLAYVLSLVVASTVAVLVSLATFVASTMQCFLSLRHRLRSMSKLCLVAIGVFFGASFLSGFFEAQLPLHLKPGCEHSAP
jgi:hypothetical protein